MDNMLYIIAVVLIVALVALLIMRRNKAQPPKVISNSRASKHSTDTLPPVNSEATTTVADPQDSPTEQSSPASATGFDTLTVAQRFVDQQRYDKAIDTLKRGLVKSPQDNPLLLKLLNIYALTHQNDDFFTTYDSIKAHGDPDTIEQAEQLKSFLEEELLQAEQVAAKANDKNNGLNDSVDIESIDFDIPTDSEQQTQSDSYLESEPEYEPERQTDTTDNDFNLSLGDLETAATSTPDLDNLDSSNDFGDFDFTDENLSSSKDSNDLENLDLNSLELDAPNLENTIESQSDITHTPAALESADKSPDAEFTLDFDFDLDFDLTSANTSLSDDSTKTESLSQEPALEEDPVLSPDQPSIDDFSFSLDDPQSENLAQETISSLVADPVTDNSDTLLFDDNTPLDDDFIFAQEDDSLHTFAANTEFEAATKDTPVTEPAQDLTAFEAQFDADFDFVKSLDSQQVTLDLAGQYLELGEYDSAKRLLEEVIAQGNSEQQQQAQALLARSA
ncbi:FimV/HubP family polar landmark protein [Psychrobacter jeotgali]|uniref:FimV/HubP family polar landmark protein n=1 Tax=Psychrobacter jeotgali TaxID=179010 RepID=UPI001918A3EF|nr:FimV/HubP family polar landmark protein [Psychrobacter jeotgali]